MATFNASAAATISCNTCQVLLSVESQREHIHSDWHRYNLKRRISSLPPLSSKIFEEKVTNARLISAGEIKGNQETICQMCQKTYNSENAYRNHLKSLKHKAMLRSAYDRTSTHPATEISDSDTMDEISLPQTPPRHIGSSDHPSISVALAKCLLCLFCNYRSPTISLNVVHMERIHGMFIPERKYLENLQGLLQHLYQKISEFHECLYCGKFKISSSALQTHMRDKGHCMIAFDSEAEMIEIGQFYDFRSTYPDQDLAKEEVEEANESDSWETDSSASSLDSEELTAVPVDREPHYYNKLYKHPHHCHHNPRPHHNKDGWHSHALHHFAVYRSEYELHLPSGRSVGHRSLARYYQQNLHNYPNTQLSLESQARADSTNQDSEVKRQNLQQVVSRANGGLGMLGVINSKKREVMFLEKREQKREQKQSSRQQWIANKKGNSQKHFRARESPNHSLSILANRPTGSSLAVNIILETH